MDNELETKSNEPKEGKSLKPKKAKPAKEPYFGTPESFAKAKKQKRIALIALSVGLMGVTVFSLLSFLGRVSGQFTIKVAPDLDVSYLRLTETLDGQKSSFLKAKGLDAAHPDLAKDVLDYVDSLDKSTLGGSNNKVKTSSSSSKETALVYTFYVHNESEEEEGLFRMNLNITDYSSPINDAKQPYSYLRVACYVNPAEEEEANDFTVYALSSSSGIGTTEGEKDDRECLSSYMIKEDLRTPTYTYDGAHGYCEDFASPYSIFQRNEAIAPKKALRITLAMWLEGEDVDCAGDVPEGTSMTFGLDIFAA